MNKKSIVWLNEVNRNDTPIVGGKGANLGEMYNLGLPVPPAFVVTAQAYANFLDYNKLNDKIKSLLEGINYEDTKQLDEVTAKIRQIIIQGNIPQDMQDEILESYKDVSADKIALEKASHTALGILKTGNEPGFVAVRSSATAEDLLTASFAGQQDTYINVKGNDQLLTSIKKCWASLFTARATYYRMKRGFSHEKTLIAVIVQKMINSDKSGVMFTINPINNDTSEIVIEAVFGLGEGIVSGAIQPDYYLLRKKDFMILKKEMGVKKIHFTRSSSGETIKKPLEPEHQKEQVLTRREIAKLANYGLKLEQHYNWPQDIEWAIEYGNVYIVQTRAVTTIKKQEEHKTISAEPMLSGMPASRGIAKGNVKIVRTLEDLERIQKGDVLVTKMTNPDMVVAMQKASAIVTDEGGLTCHAAIVSRELGIPSIVGTQTATQKLKDNMLITVDGTTGKVYEGDVTEKIKTQTEQSGVSEVVEKGIQNQKKEEKKTKIKVKVICDLPQTAERAASTNAVGVGLVRIEFIIVNSGKHPAWYLKNNKLDKYTNLLADGIKQIALAFKDKPVWVRTSDVRTDEYRNLEGGELEPTESDPMIGWHGIRRSLDQPELLKAEFKAIKQLHDQGFNNVGVMLPFVINVDELKKAKELMKEVGLEPLKDVEFGVMVETPAACWIIDDLCKEGINFISFGTNDLTQLTLGIDRNNERIAKLYTEMHPAVLGEMDKVIQTCKRYGVETSICGQAGSKPEMVKWLVKHNIDSISANIDAVTMVRQTVSEEEDGENKEKEENGGHVRNEYKNNEIETENKTQTVDKIDNKGINNNSINNNNNNVTSVGGIADTRNVTNMNRDASINSNISNNSITNTSNMDKQSSRTLQNTDMGNNNNNDIKIEELSINELNHLDKDVDELLDEGLY